MFQIEQPVCGSSALGVCQNTEADDISLCQHISVVGGQEGKLALCIQSVERGLLTRCRSRCDAILDNLRFIRAGQTQRLFPALQILINKAFDLLRIAGCGIAADDADIVAIHAETDLRHNGIIAALS